MSADIYKFSVGTFECIAIRDWLATYKNPVRVLFFKAPKDRLKQALREYGIGITNYQEWISPYTCLFIQTESHKVLVDTGIGSIWPPDHGYLIQLLETLAIKPSEIDIVLITHAHGDHCGGNTDEEGRPAFPNARYIMMKAEWDFWIAEETLQQPQYEWMSIVVEKSMKPLQDRFELITKDTEIVPGIEVIKASGHTPGHFVVRISSGGKQLWYMSDTFLHPLHIEHPDWSAEVDVEPEKAAITRHSILDQVSNSKYLIHCFHFDFPGLGTIRERNGMHLWKPLSLDGFDNS